MSSNFFLWRFEVVLWLQSRCGVFPNSCCKRVFWLIQNHILVLRFLNWHYVTNANSSSNCLSKPFWTKLSEQKILLHQMITMNTSPKNSQIRWKNPSLPTLFLEHPKVGGSFDTNLAPGAAWGASDYSPSTLEGWKVGKIHHFLTRYLNDFGCPWSKSASTIFSFLAFKKVQKTWTEKSKWIKRGGCRSFFFWGTQKMGKKCLFWSPENKNEISHKNWLYSFPLIGLHTYGFLCMKQTSYVFPLGDETWIKKKWRHLASLFGKRHLSTKLLHMKEAQTELAKAVDVVDVADVALAA